MGHRISRVYTRTGDEGDTGLGDGSRIEKSSLRIAAMGDVDELNSEIGLLLSCDIPKRIREPLNEVQHDLFDLGGELAVPGAAAITPGYVVRLEENLDALNRTLPPLEEFVLPGGSPAAAICHVGRAVCRRAERKVVELAKHENVNPQALCYLNRLSDLLFVLARTLVREVGGAEVLWQRDRRPQKD
ncbi:MAG: cob(I)yrinic acid a,c-diamide adenosyltransferase [Gammaproteobacteria bacterium]|nr:cob(I)yrinic acid a,c-diamide adenosyltransferase [Gammaproteobacteria bacterium]MCI0591660.1 cob(I)yrinic acid a,c-diamide adenosyltransferase [Gammaproteobacteria bacterium]